ncbi:MAG: chemotaxis protein CheW [bacterium]
MNNAFNLYDLRDFKAVGSDLVTPWIGDLLDKKNAAETRQSAQILSYPVEKLLTPEPLAEPAEGFDIHIVPQVNAAPLPSKAAEKEVSYFTFISDGSLYALPSLNINEIIKYKTPVSIFSRKAGHLGIILYRNKMVPVYDFSMIINAGIINAAAGIKAGFKYTVVCIYDNKFFGLSVSEIKNITRVKNKNLILSSTFKFKNSNNISSGVFEDEEGKFHSIIDIESIYEHLTS